MQGSDMIRLDCIFAKSKHSDFHEKIEQAHETKQILGPIVMFLGCDLRVRCNSDICQCGSLWCQRILQDIRIGLRLVQY